MPCSIAITGVSGTQNVGSVTIDISGTSQQVKNVTVTIRCGDQSFPGLVAILDQVSGDWAYQGPINCSCGGPIVVLAQYDDGSGNPMPNCPVATFNGTLLCGPPSCCLSPKIVVTVDDQCTSSGQREATFAITGTADPACLPYVFILDFGDLSTSAVIINSAGSFSNISTHLYTAGTSSTTFNASLDDQMYLDCGSIPIAVVIDPCSVPDCCANNVNVVVEDLGCIDGTCKRDFKITTTFDPPVGTCPPAYLQWKFSDLNGILVASGDPFITSTGAPWVDTIELGSDQSPVTGHLVHSFPITGCTDIIETIIIDPCETPPACPVINDFSFHVLDCRVIGDSCCTKVEFTLDALFSLGCGNQTSPEIEIDFGDGSVPETLNILYSGNQVHYFDHEYCTPGEYTVQLTISNSVDCLLPELKITIEPCDEEPAVCPTIAINNVVIEDECNDCRREVELLLSYKNPNPCAAPATFHIEWGDGDRHPNATSTPNTIEVTNSQAVVPFSHDFSKGNYDIQVIVDSPTGCAVLTENVEIPECDGCQPCKEKGWLSWLCPFFEILMVSGFSLGILWLILATCITSLPVWVAIIFFAIGVLGMVLYLLLCKCRPCGWLWITLWKIFLGVGLALLVFWNCCSSLFVFGLISIALSFIFYWLWTNKCHPTICQKLKHLTSLWITILIPVIAWAIAIPGLNNCYSPLILAIIATIMAPIAAMAIFCQD